MGKAIGNQRSINSIGEIMSKLAILAEFWDFMRVRKKWWLAPIVFVLVLLSLMIVLLEKHAILQTLYMLF